MPYPIRDFRLTETMDDPSGCVFHDGDHPAKRVTAHGAESKFVIWQCAVTEANFYAIQNDPVWYSGTP